jgi:catecholate siderophore receptor
MQDRGDIDLTAVVRNVPSITLESSESSWEGNNPYIRGFSARTDMFLDGMRDFGFYFRDPWNMDKVEVLEGPDSILFGRGSTGGVINEVSKMPVLQSFTDASVSGGTNDLARGTIDFNAPIDGLGTPAAFRINAMGNKNGVEGRDPVDFNRYGFAPSLALGLGTPDRLDVSYFHQSEHNIPDFGVPWYFGRPSPVDTSNYYGFKTDHLDTNADIATAKYEHDFNDSWMVREQFRYADYTRNIVGDKPALPASAKPTTPLSTINLTLNAFTLNSTESELENQTDLVGHFDTGAIHHDLVAGIEYDAEGSAPNFSQVSGLTNNFVDPVAKPYVPTAIFPRVRIDTTTNTEGAYVLDTMKFGDQWEAILGARFDRFSVHFNEDVFAVPPAKTGVITKVNTEDQANDMPTWHGALVYKPLPNASVYFTYGTSFDPSAESLDEITSFTSFSLHDAKLSPEKNRTYEFGTKWAFMDNKLNLSGSLFETDKYNARIPDPTIPGFDMLGGNERVDGFELLAQGALSELWNVTVGYDYLDSSTTKTTPGGPPLGRPLPFVAKNNLTFWTTYMVLPNVEIGAGGQYLSDRYAQLTAPVEKSPGYVTFDAMAKYVLNDKFDLQVNVYNITDKSYYDVLHPQYVVPGAGRSAMFTVNYSD